MRQSSGAHGTSAGKYKSCETKHFVLVQRRETKLLMVHSWWEYLALYIDPLVIIPNTHEPREHSP